MIESNNINYSIAKSEEEKQQIAYSHQNNGSITKSSARAQKQKSIFPHKLWQMVNDEQLNSAIRWNPDGRSFSVFENQFRSRCLGKENKFFYTNQPKSFVRQLHLYGFRKVNKNQFVHPNFKRDFPELLVNIKRTYKQTCLSSDKLESNDQLDSTYQEESTDQAESTEQVESSDQPESSDQLELNEQMKCSDLLESSETQQEENNSYNNENIKYEPLKNMTHIENQQNQNFEKVQPLDHNIELFNEAGVIKSGQLVNYQQIPTVGALVFANNYDESYGVCPTTWYETNYVDINYNYNDDNILTLYNNDIYPNTCEDNNITL